MRTERAPSGVGHRGDTCLYYPYFTVDDETWLKQALVWWDRIATIVPRDVPLQSFVDDRVRSLMEADAFQAWPVEQEVRRAAAEAAIRLLDDGVLAEVPEGEPFELHFGKMTEDLARELGERGQVLERTPRGILVRGSTGLLIVGILAHVLAEETKAWPLTNEPDLAGTYLAIARRGGAGGGAQAVLQQDLELTVPNLESVELPAWLKFRADHRSELEAYRKSIKALARSVAHASSEDEAAEILTERRGQVQLEVERSTSVFRKLTSDTRLGALSLVVDLGVGIASGANPILTAVGLIPGAALLARGFRDREVHHLSFLMRAGKELA